MGRKCGMTSRIDRELSEELFLGLSGNRLPPSPKGVLALPTSTSCGARRPQAGHFKHFHKQWAPKFILLSI